MRIGAPAQTKSSQTGASPPPLVAGPAQRTQLGFVRRWSDSSSVLRNLLVLAAYGASFTLLRESSAHWATHHLFSVWFPAAGLRFAFLWVAGARWAPAAALAELLVSVGAGTVTLSAPLPLSLIGVAGPCLVYGGVIGLVHARMAKRGTAEADPVAFAIAAVAGPMAACIAALPWAIPLASARGPLSPQLLFSALLVFTLGDLLGILILAPPLLWLANRVRRHTWSFKVGAAQLYRYGELLLLLSCAWALVWMLQRLGDGLVLAPVLLAACWCGLRGGRAVAWVATLLSALLILPGTEDRTSDALRVQDHMQLACVAVGAFLAGSFADAQKRAMFEIGRRDRLLLRAERLKTLRAMSLAVIHEVSQPLSTIAIEARAMVDASRSTTVDRNELSEIAALIARKTDDLAELIRRLRGFGSGGNEGRALQSLRQMVSDVIALAAPEAKNAGISIEEAAGPDLSANVNDVEVRQALLNLVRNAVAAAPKPDGVIRIGWSQIEGSVRIWVENAVVGGRRSHEGMGLGLIIARSIAQAHGGGLFLEQIEGGCVRAGLDLPIDEGPLE